MWNNCFSATQGYSQNGIGSYRKRYLGVPKNTVDLIKELQKDYSCLAVEQTENAIPLNQFVPKSSTKYALIFGNEVKGVSQEVVDSCQGVLEIPQYGTKHSLNISVSAGVVIWDLWSKLQPASKIE